MKRTGEALLHLPTRAVSVAVALTLVAAAAAPVARAATPTVQMRIQALLTPPSKAVGPRAPTSRMHLHAAFSADPLGAQLFTVQRAVLLFPDRGTNGRFFPSCSAAQIARFRGDTSLCPKGSQVGSGSVTAQVVPAGVAAAARVTLFNSHHGKSITFNFRSTKPAVINESFDAPLTRLPGKYPMKLVMDVPGSLQEVLPGLFVGLQTMDVTLDAAVTVRGIRRSFLEAGACPENSMHGEFTFLDSTTGQSSVVATDAALDCRTR